MFDGPGRAPARETWIPSWVARPSQSASPREFLQIGPGAFHLVRCSLPNLKNTIRSLPCPWDGPHVVMGGSEPRPMICAKWYTTQNAITTLAARVQPALLVCKCINNDTTLLHESYVGMSAPAPLLSDALPMLICCQQ